MKKDKKTKKTCSFCDAPQESVGILIWCEKTEVCICERCIAICVNEMADAWTRNKVINKDR